LRVALALALDLELTRRELRELTPIIGKPLARSIGLLPGAEQRRLGQQALRHELLLTRDTLGEPR
jgi:hypothetical protein